MTPRRRLLTLFAVALTAAVVGPVSSATARSAYCSPTGDYCTSIVKRGGVVNLRIGTQAAYFRRYRLCVSPPTGRRTCRTFRLRRDRRIYGSTVRWSRYFPNRGRGTYRVAWYAQTRLGPALDFRR